MVKQPESYMVQQILITQITDKQLKTNTMKQVKTTREKKYGLIQMPIEVHAEIKAYCEKHGFKISALTANIIRKYLKENK